MHPWTTRRIDRTNCCPSCEIASRSSTHTTTDKATANREIFTSPLGKARSDSSRSCAPSARAGSTVTRRSSCSRARERRKWRASPRPVRGSREQSSSSPGDGQGFCHGRVPPERCECVLENRDLFLRFGLRVGVFVAPLPPVRPFVRELVLQAIHECRVAVGVNFPDSLVCQEIPVVLRLWRCAGSRGCASLPLLDRLERELPLVWSDFALVPKPVRIDPGVAAADRPSPVLLPLELLQIVVAHAIRNKCPMKHLVKGEGDDRKCP